MKKKAKRIKVINFINIIKKIRNKLPQITRFFPAKIIFFGKVIFWALVFGFLAYNFLALPYFDDWRGQINKDSYEAHIKLAERFAENNDLVGAEREYQLANSNLKNQNSKLIKDINNKLRTIKGKLEEVDKLEKEVTTWEEILRERPNYRDACLKLAMLNYQLKRPLTARDYLLKAIELDPNFPLTKELQKVLKISN